MQSFRTMSRDPAIQGQSFFCFSVVGPEAKQKAKVSMFKVRYVADTEDDAKAFAKAIHAKDPDFDIFLLPMGTWLPFVDDPLTADHTVYDDSFLEELINEHKKQQRENAKIFAERVKAEKHYIRNKAVETPGDEESDLDDAIRLRYDIYKLESHIKTSEGDLDLMHQKYAKYSDSIRTSADSVELPKIDV